MAAMTVGCSARQVPGAEFASGINECGRGNLHVCPTVLNWDTEATIQLPPKHPAGWAVRTPRGEWIDVVEPGDEATAFPLFHLTNQQQFRVSSLTGTAWRDGKPVRVDVFCEPGLYIFYFADNLETEPENTFSLAIAVRFTGRGLGPCESR